MLACILPAITGIMSLFATQHARGEQRSLVRRAKLAERQHARDPREPMPELMEHRADCQVNPDKANPQPRIAIYHKTDYANSLTRLSTALTGTKHARFSHCASRA
jgi:hypothetical protein